jgi:hypothetical protein
MKFALISLKNLKVEKHWNLILETMEDVQAYFAASTDLSAHQFLDVWKAMKNGHSPTSCKSTCSSKLRYRRRDAG